jgi:hypothetical protein
VHVVKQMILNALIINFETALLQGNLQGKHYVNNPTGMN